MTDGPKVYELGGGVVHGKEHMAAYRFRKENRESE